MKVASILAALSLFAIEPARAAPDAAAYGLYVAGDYQAAVERARAAGGAEDFALAARAMNAVAYFEEGRKSSRRKADDALDLAEKAIELDPGLPEAHLQAAIALALKGARMSPVRALFAGLASKARREIDEAMALNPGNPWALSTSAAWRLEVSRRGGGALYDADPDLGFNEFMQARAADPDNPAIAYECALRLLAAGRTEWRAPALAALEAAIAASPETKFERDIQALARALRAAIDNGPQAEQAFIDAQP